MRGFLGLLVVVALLVPAVGAVAGEPTEYYKDKFNGSGYGGSDGSLPWESPWVEIEESDGPGKGNVHVGPEGCFGSNCLHLEGGLLDLEYYGARRSANLSLFETVELCFEMRMEGVSNAKLEVYVTRDGSNWDLEGSYRVLDGGDPHPIIDLDDYRTKQFALKFVVTGLLSLGDSITIDNVELKGTVAGSSTTSSTTSTSSSTSTSSTSSTSTSTSTTSTTTPRSGSTSTSSSSTTSSTSTTQPAVTSSTNEPARQEAQQESTTTTTSASTTSTSSGTGAGLPPQPPFDSGLRDTPGGLMADYEEGMMGDMAMDDVEVLGAEITADFSMAVEAFEAAKVWIAVLVLFITAAIVSGMDWRRTRTDTG